MVWGNISSAERILKGPVPGASFTGSGMLPELALTGIIIPQPVTQPKSPQPRPTLHKVTGGISKPPLNNHKKHIRQHGIRIHGHVNRPNHAPNHAPKPLMAELLHNNVNRNDNGCAIPQCGAPNHMLPLPVEMPPVVLPANQLYRINPEPVAVEIRCVPDDVDIVGPQEQLPAFTNHNQLQLPGGMIGAQQIQQHMPAAGNARIGMHMNSTQQQPHMPSVRASVPKHLQIGNRADTSHQQSYNVASNGNENIEHPIKTTHDNVTPPAVYSSHLSMPPMFKPGDQALPIIVGHQNHVGPALQLNADSISTLDNKAEVFLPSIFYVVANSHSTDKPETLPDVHQQLPQYNSTHDGYLCVEGRHPPMPSMQPYENHAQPGMHVFDIHIGYPAQHQQHERVGDMHADKDVMQAAERHRLVQAALDHQRHLQAEHHTNESQFWHNAHSERVAAGPGHWGDHTAGVDCNASIVMTSTSNVCVKGNGLQHKSLAVIGTYDSVAGVADGVTSGGNCNFDVTGNRWMNPANGSSNQGMQNLTVNDYEHRFANRMPGYNEGCHVMNASVANDNLQHAYVLPGWN